MLLDTDCAPILGILFQAMLLSLASVREIHVDLPHIPPRCSGIDIAGDILAFKDLPAAPRGRQTSGMEGLGFWEPRKIPSGDPALFGSRIVKDFLPGA